MLHGKPLMAYTIDAALNSNVFDDVIVSTDSEEYADIAKGQGAWVPFLRGSALSGDAVPLSAVTLDVIDQLEALGNAYEYCCMLQPTCPLRSADDIANAYATLQTKQATAVVSVVAKKHPRYTCGELDATLSLDGFIAKAHREVMRQDMNKLYEISGALCFLHVASYMQSKTPYGARSYAHVLSSSHALDIDTHLDFALAEVLLANPQLQH